MFGFFKKAAKVDESRIFLGMSIGELVEFRKDMQEDKKHLVDTEILNIIKETGMEGLLTIQTYIDDPKVTSL
tara:strand:+ start:461 stop:676 length:216 start_codon:yes stop_codon:yes gene_type:complete